MKDKKNIDEVFKDALNNLEASPSPRVWENIQAVLKKEKSERKVIPLWIRIGGVAALIALLLSVGNWAFDPLHLDKPAITKENNNRIEEELLDKSRSEQEGEEIRIASESDLVIEASSSEENSKGNTENSKSDYNSQISSPVSKEIVSPNKFSKNSVASENSKYSIERDSETSSTKGNSNQDRIVSSETPSTVISNVENEGDVTSERIMSEINREKEISFDSEGREDVAIEIADNVVAEEKEEDSISKISLLDAIAEQENLKDKDQTNESLERRWKVTPNVAPVYYSSLGNGSSIDPEFANSPQKGDVNMSYGVQVSYALNSKLSLRTGVNNVDLSYSTSDIIIASGPVAVGLRGVDYGSDQTVVTAINRATLNSNTSGNFGSLNLKSTSGEARLIQSINYYEIPLELQYAVIDSKFGVNLIGGVSTLFLGNNEISVKSDNFSSVLGAANNLSNVSFSTNVGLGLNYKLSKSFIFNVEPMFKYQLSTYSDSSVDFKPYYLGVYSGISFKF
jgi:hypothetical protein